MPRKKKSPVVEMTGQILDEVNRHNELVCENRRNFKKLLTQIEWNLLQSKSFDYNSGQALRYSRGALLMLNQDIRGN